MEDLAVAVRFELVNPSRTHGLVSERVRIQVGVPDQTLVLAKIQLSRR